MIFGARPRTGHGEALHIIRSFLRLIARVAPQSRPAGPKVRVLIRD